MAETKSTDRPAKGGANGFVLGALPFVIGLIGALVIGWVIFPMLLFSEQEQPLRFSHRVHMEEVMMDCTDCHFMREDGTFSGIPNLESCMMCHDTAPLGDDPEEERFIAEYIEQEREIPWLIYQKQPDNVFFSHAAHGLDNCTACHIDEYENPNQLCISCHPNVAEADDAPLYRENRLTGYSSMTMKMDRCESCHAIHMDTGQTSASNACFVCHK